MLLGPVAIRVLNTVFGSVMCVNAGVAWLALVERQMPLFAVVWNPMSSMPTSRVVELPGMNATSVDAGKNPVPLFVCGRLPADLGERAASRRCRSW